jgi:hypothetical protein
MHGMSVTLRPIVALTLTADDWQLYDLEGRDTVALRLNRLVEESINEAHTMSDAIKGINEALVYFRHFGANDSEGVAVARWIMQRAYPGARQ